MPDAMILVGAVAAGFVQGVSGFALALVATVFWTGSMPPQVAAPLIALCSIGGQALSVKQVLPSLDVRLAAPMVAGGLAGVPLGVWLLPSVEPNEFRLVVGLLLCVFCPAMLALRHLPRVRWGGGAMDGAVGLAGGVMGGLAGLSGPVPILWCALRGWDKDRQRATFQTFLIATQAASLLAYAVAGLLTAPLLHLALWTLPCALAPSWLGSKLYARLGGAAFRRVVLGVLLVTGATLVAQGVRGR